MANFNTKVNFSNQIIQYPNTTGTLSGSVNVEQYTTLGIDYSDLPLGLDPSSTGSTYFSIGVFGNFSGDTGSTTFYFSDPNMYLGTPYLSALTPSNSGITQNIFVTQPTYSLTVDGNYFDIYFTGVTYDLTPTTFVEYSPGFYSGDLLTNILVYVSGTTYPWWFLKSGSTTWNEVKGRLKTDKITISQSASTGYVLTALDSDGNATWQPPVNNTFTGNTSATCITDLYISNLNSCSPLRIQNISSGDVLIGENGGVNVGIGTSTPNYKLHVSGKTYIEGDVDILGNVNIIGSATTINTEVVQSKDNKILLNYSGTNSTAIGGGIEILSAKTNGNSVELITDVNGDWNSNTGLNVVGRTDNSTSYSLKIQNSGGTNNFVVRGDGNVGIGTNSPTQKLHVSGNTLLSNSINGDLYVLVDNKEIGGINTRSAVFQRVVAESTGTDFLVGGMALSGYETDLSGFGFSDNGTGYLKNAFTMTLAGSYTYGSINIGTRGAPSMLRFFSGNQDFDSTSLRGSLDSNGNWGFGQNMTGQTAIVHIKGGGSSSLTNSLKIDNSSNSPLLYVRDDGNVGIGVENPTEKLHISGNTKITGGLIIGTIGSGSPLINLGLDSNGNVVTGTTGTGGGSGTFTGGTGSCITDLYVTNIHGCSPVNVLDTTIFNYGGTNVIINSGTTVLRTTNNNVIFTESDGTYTRLFNFHNNPGVRDDILLEVVETATTETTQLLVGVGSVTNRITNNDNYSVYQFSTNGVDFRDLSQNQFSGMTFNLSYNVYNPPTSNVNLTYTNDVVTPFYIHNRGYDITTDSLYYDISISANSIVFGSTDGLPTAKFDIAYSGGTSNFRIREGAQNGYVLTSDSNGYATWQPNNSSGNTITMFTGNTSATCITDLYLTNLYGCSPITVHDILSGNSGGAYINLNTDLTFTYTPLQLGIGDPFIGSYISFGSQNILLNTPNNTILTNNGNNSYYSLYDYGISLSSVPGGTMTASTIILTTTNSTNFGSPLTGGSQQGEIVFGIPNLDTGLPLGVMGTGLGSQTVPYGTPGVDYNPVFISTPRSRAYDNASYSSIKNVLFGGGSDNSVYSGVTNSALIGGSGNTINNNVKNSIILGGQNTTATTSNTVYVPDLVIKKSASIPTSSGSTVGDIGSITWDENYFYVKTLSGWGRTVLNYNF